MWVLGLSVFVPYLAFSFSYPFVTELCNYELGKCTLQDDIPYKIMSASFIGSYYAWWLLAPLALLCGLADTIISVVRQIRSV